MAVSVPSRLAPSVTRCIVAMAIAGVGLLAFAVEHAAHGTPGLFAKARPRRTSQCGAPFFAPNPPPM